MAKSLVIVESPTKARTISQILGSEYSVMASVGHEGTYAIPGLVLLSRIR